MASYKIISEEEAQHIKDRIRTLSESFMKQLLADGIIRNEPLELSELEHFLLNADVSHKPISDKYRCTENVTPAYTALENF